MWALTASSVGVGRPLVLPPDDPLVLDTNDESVYTRNPYASLPASVASDRTKHAPTASAVRTAWARQTTAAAGAALHAELETWAQTHSAEKGYVLQRWRPASSHAAWDGTQLDDARLRAHYADYNVKLMVLWMATKTVAKAQVSRVYWHDNRDTVETVYVFRKRDAARKRWMYLTLTGPEADATNETPTRRKPRATKAQGTGAETKAQAPLKCVKQATKVLAMHDLVKRGFIAPALANEIRDVLVPQFSKIFHYGALFLEYVFLRRIERPAEIAADDATYWPIDRTNTAKLAFLLMTTNVSDRTGSPEIRQYLPDFLALSGYERVKVKANCDNIIGDFADRLIASLKVHYSEPKLLQAVRKFLTVHTGAKGDVVTAMLGATEIEQLREVTNFSCRVRAIAWKAVKMWGVVKRRHFPEGSPKAKLTDWQFVKDVACLRRKLGAGPLVPHGSESRVFVRIPDSMFEDWNEAPTVRSLARYLKVHDPYGRSVKACPGRGEYIGNSINTDGIQVHVVIRTVDDNQRLVEVKDEDAEDGCEAESNQDSKRRYWNRNMTTKDAQGFCKNKNGVYGFQDIAEDPEAVELLRYLSEHGLVVGVDPGKVYCATAVNVANTSRIMHFSQKEYYGQLKYRGASFEGGGWLWRKRHLFGYQPAYFRAACTGLLSLAGGTLPSFEAGLRQRVSPLQVPFCRRKQDTLCQKLSRLVASPRGLQDGSRRCDFLWAYQLSVKRALLRFQSYKRRQRLIASFVQRIARDCQTVVLWGDGYDGSQHQRCNMPAPSKKLLRSLGAVRRVVMVPEFRTTRACCECTQAGRVYVPTLPVYRQVTNPETGVVSSKDVGTRWCPQCKRTFGRDASGAKNILAGGLARILTGAPLEGLKCRAGREVVFGGYDQWYTSSATPTPHLKRVRPSGN